MRYYAYLNENEFGKLLDSKIENKNVSKYVTFSDSLEVFLTASQILASVSDGFLRGGIVCEFEIPDGVLGKMETLELASEDGENEKFNATTIMTEQVQKSWLRSWVVDNDFALSAEGALKVLDSITNNLNSQQETSEFENNKE